MKRSIACIISLVLLLSLMIPFPGTNQTASAVTAPVTSHTIIGSRHANGIYYGTVEVRLSVADTGSGISVTRYSLDNGATWSAYTQPLVFTDKRVYNLLYQSIDNNNNAETPKSVSFTIKQDLFPPETTVQVTGTQGQNFYYTGPVTVTLNGSDAHAGLDYSEYSFDGGQTWERYVSPFSMSEQQNTIIHYRSIDVSGNVEKTKKIKVSLDLTSPGAPDFIVSPGEWSHSSYTVEILDGTDDQSGTFKSQYRIGDSQNWADYSDPVQVNGDVAETIYARTLDYAGNASEIVEYTLQFDKIAPTAPVVELDYLDWTNDVVHVRVYEGTDVESGVMKYEYRIGDNPEWLEFVDPFPIEAEGVTSVYGRTVDFAGNISGVAEGAAKIDLTPPAAPSFSPESEAWTNADVHLSIIPGTDSLSGADYIIFAFDESEEWARYETPLEFTEEGVTTVRAITFDKAGNGSDENAHVVRIDKTPPTSPGLSATTSDWTNQDVVVTLDSGTDELSGVDRNEYRIGGSGEWTLYTEPFTMSEEGDFIVYARTLDVAGNISEWSEIAVKIDKTAPSAPEHVYKVNQTGTSALIQWTASTDNLSGIELYQVYNGNNLVAATTDTRIQLSGLVSGSQYSITVKAVDKAKNVSDSSQPPLVFFVNSTMVEGVRQNFAWNEFGTVWGWGLNDQGQLGDGTTINRSTAVTIPALQDYTMISTGLRENIGLRADGTVWTWGMLFNGQSAPPAKVDGLDNIVSISTGGLHFMALKEDGTVWTWGDNAFGQLGDGTDTFRSVPMQVPGLSSVVAVSGSYYNSLALKEDGTVWVWGSSLHGALGKNVATGYLQKTPMQITELSDIIQIDMAYLHGMALRKDGTVWTWGFNQYGQLGDETVTDRAAPAQVQGLSGIVKISASYAHSLALSEDGMVWAWGDNTYGEVGDGTAVQQRTKPVRAAHATGMTDIVAAEFYSFAIKSDGSIWSWGNNAYGQLGNGTTTGQATRGLVQGVPYPSDTIVPVAPQQLTAVDKTSSSILLQWGEATDNHGVKEYRVYRGTSLIETIAVEGKSLESATRYTVTGLSPSTTYTFTVKALDYAGNSSAGSNEITEKTTSAMPISVSADSNHTLALKSDGSVWSWGSNSSGQLGHGTQTNSLVPKQTINLASVIEISAGSSFSLALKGDGTVWGWGNNSIGQLGNNTTQNVNTPQQISGLNSVVAIAAGSTHGMALKSDGTVWTWGMNVYGELGIGSTTAKYTPTLVPTLSGVKSISAGGGTSFAVKADGSLWAWGANSYGQLGDGTTRNKTTPVQITGISGVSEVSAGRNHTLALKTDGTVWSWGNNGGGKVGDGTTTQRNSPVKVTSLSGISQISAGEYHSMAMMESTVYTWGYNSNGQLGNNSTTTSYVPVALSSLSNIKAIDAGTDHSVSIANNNVMSWGYNGNGQLGNGTTTTSRVPVAASGLVTTSGVNRSATVDQQVELDSNHFLKELGIPDEIEVPDWFAPAPPSDVKAELTNHTLTLRWTPSVDNIGVAEYRVYGNEELLLATSSHEAVTIPLISGQRPYSITVKAADAAGNVSGPSIPVTPS
ncbi:OmpL47-type beta-barrel domain-containing protein [Cohnella massiliensis]|uniref:RCC1 domain-containing protein n=1 Tax=Cohnella massiliensis TaxID=1816691 RepID=UPI0009BC4135|nr:fibronectin type III domain-containing protein [Cohnella massiliensis]